MLYRFVREQYSLLTLKNYKKPDMRFLKSYVTGKLLHNQPKAFAAGIERLHLAARPMRHQMQG